MPNKGTQDPPIVDEKPGLRTGFGDAAQGTAAPAETAPVTEANLPGSDAGLTNYFNQRRTAPRKGGLSEALLMGQNGNGLGALALILSILFEDPQMLGFFESFLFPKDQFADDASRTKAVENFRTVVNDPNHAARNLPIAELIKTYLPHYKDQATLLRPDLLDKLATSGPSHIKNMVNTTLAAVEDYNAKLPPGAIPLDGYMVVNQLWQESRFKPDAMGPQTKYGRAVGIAQFLPETGAKYGLHSHADLTNPAKAIPAAVKFLGDQTQKYGDQGLAMVAYNGGGKAVSWAAGELNMDKSAMTIKDWMAYTTALNEQLGEGARNLWRNQTHEYVALTDSNFWSDSKRAQAAAKMRDLGLTVPEEQPAQMATADVKSPEGVAPA